MNKGTSVALLVIGIVLLIFGFNAYQSASSSVSLAVTGAPTTKAIVLLVIGFIAAIGGGFGVARK